MQLWTVFEQVSAAPSPEPRREFFDAFKQQLLTEARQKILTQYMFTRKAA